MHCHSSLLSRTPRARTASSMPTLFLPPTLRQGKDVQVSGPCMCSRFSIPEPSLQACLLLSLPGSGWATFLGPDDQVQSPPRFPAPFRVAPAPACFPSPSTTHLILSILQAQNLAPVPETSMITKPCLAPGPQPLTVGHVLAPGSEASRLGLYFLYCNQNRVSRVIERDEGWCVRRGEV